MPAKGKRTLNGYQLFARETREAIKADGFSGRDITSELSRRWAKVDEKKKQQFKERAEKAKYNVFQLWSKEHREEVAKEGMKPGEIMSELRRLWKDVSEEEKQRYHDEIDAVKPKRKS